MHFDSTELLSTPVYGECNAESNPVIDKDPIQGEVEIIQLAACEGNHDKRW